MRQPRNAQSGRGIPKHDLPTFGRGVLHHGSAGGRELAWPARAHGSLPAPRCPSPAPGGLMAGGSRSLRGCGLRPAQLRAAPAREKSSARPPGRSAAQEAVAN